MDAPTSAPSEQNDQPDEPPSSTSPTRHRRRQTRSSSRNIEASSAQAPVPTSNPDAPSSPSQDQRRSEPSQPDPLAATPAGTQTTSAPPATEAQNHDRMETDDDSNESRSSAGTRTPEQSEGTTEPAPPPAPSGDAMDTAPDVAAIVNPDATTTTANTTANANQTPTQPVTIPASTVNTNNIFTATTVRIGVTANIGLNQAGVATLLDTPSLSFNMNGADINPSDIHVTIPNSALESVRNNNRQPPPPQRDDSVESLARNRRERREDRHNDDNSSDSSEDEEENPYWANFKEDTSGPDERELKILEESEKNMPSATDHEHWEKSTFENLDDPEYIAADIGRIQWTLKGVHGTPDKPTRESIMKSPSVKIGDFYWWIKFYPRGNDGTEQVSIYLECSPTPWEDSEPKESPAPEAGSANAAAASTTQEASNSDAAPTSDNATSNNTVQANDVATNADTPMTDAEAEVPTGTEQANDTPMNGGPPEERRHQPPQASNLEDAGTSDQPPERKPSVSGSTTSSEPEAPWRIAAQACVVMYNPNEPRVYAQQKSTHSYYNDNPDWGWTRFHGPWDDLHQRKRYQRQAMLRNDTLAFTAYIRLVKDETKSLWWHPPKDRSGWDSLEMTGVRAFKSIHPNQSSAVVAAFSAWLHLKPVLDIIRTRATPDYFFEPDVTPRPLLEELHDLLSEHGEYGDKTKDIPLTRITTIVDARSFDGIKKMDVVAIWEHLRRVFTSEISGETDLKAASEKVETLFQDFLLLKQPDYFGLDPNSLKYTPDKRDIPALSQDHEATSVQEGLDLASQHSSKAYRLWECFPGQHQDLPKSPSVLAVELHRQHFDDSSRKWMKLGHKIGLDEEILLSETAYSLYGLIVHSGSLESQDFYTVVRPGGPGSRWLKYTGENSSRKVSVLTTKQAVADHEGSGEPVLQKSKSERKKENASVAYVAIYVRKDNLQGILETPFDRALLDVQAKDKEVIDEAKPTEESTKPGKAVTVIFYFGNAFSGANKLDKFNPWSQSTADQLQDTYRLELRDTLKVSEVKDVLEEVLAQAFPQADSKTMRLWILDARQPCLGALPAFFHYELHAEKSLSEVPHFAGGCRFWIGGQDLDVLRKVMGQAAGMESTELLKLKKEPKPDAVIPKPESAEPSAEISSAAPQSSEAVEINQSGANEEGEALEQTNAASTDAPAILTNGTSEQATDVQAVSATETNANADSVPNSAPAASTQSNGDVANDNSGDQQSNAEPTANADTDMADAPNAETQPPEPTSSEDTSAANAPPDPPERQVICFLKIFDFSQQVLTDKTTFLAPLSASVHAEIRKALGVETKPKEDGELPDADSQDEWDFYHERIQWAKSYELVNSGNSFENYVISTELLPSDMSITIPSDGAVFIAQRRPSPEETSTLEAEGKPTTAPAFMNLLVAQQNNPTFSHPTRTTSYLGSPYFSGSQSYARPHGPGTLVSLSGDYYTGPFSSGSKSGTDGKMVYQNKDVYEGSWEADEPQGEGQMVYAKTGNVYKGGWKRGRRHGKGMMQMEVADEEMRLCQVCYEGEMDSLFYACGHVCACETCARQLENCPVCRERVRGVVKVRWTV